MIEQKTKEVIAGANTPQEISQRISNFVRDNIPYYLDEWTVSAEDVLNNGKGMCSGKALLAAEMHKAAGISSRFVVIKVMGEEGLFTFLERWIEHQSISPQNKQSIIDSFRSLPPERDHIIVQVFVDNQWLDLDLARDTGLDLGMRFIGIWRERRILYREGPYNSLDDWLKGRMKRRSVMINRELFFQTANEQMANIRRIGNMTQKSGLSGWNDDQVREKLKGLELIQSPAGLRKSGQFDELANQARTKLAKAKTPETKAAFEDNLLSWLYSFVRNNVKRGRYWELSDVLTRHQADCLGYARLLTFLTREFGLDSGTIEVIQDIRRKYVPHYVCLINLADGRKRLLDPWYGSSDMTHKAMFAPLAGKPSARKFTMKVLQKAGRIEGLASEQLAGISLYIQGNAYLSRGDAYRAVECYDLSLWLYVKNPRALYNRALALELLDKTKQAQVDYHHAFSLPSSMIRIMATIEHIEPLIDLDEKRIDDLSQSVYLLREGYITGHQERWADIADKYKLTLSKARRIYNSTLTKLCESAQVKR